WRRPSRGSGVPSTRGGSDGCSGTVLCEPPTITQEAAMTFRVRTRTVQLASSAVIASALATVGAVPPAVPALAAAGRSADAGPATRPSAIGAVPVVTGLDFPATFTFAPDGRIFYGERFTGEIRIF